MMSASACTSAARPNRSAFVAGVNSQLFNERIDLRDLCTAITTPQTLDNRPIQMQSSGQCDGAESTALAAYEPAENSEVLKCQRKPNRTKRSRLSLWCRSKQVYARVKMMGFELPHFFELYS